VTTITTANITNLASVATIMGQVVVYQTKALLLAATGMKANDLAAVVADSTTANNAFYFYNGAWTVLTATSFDASAITSGTIDSARLPTVPVTKGGTGVTSFTANQFVITNSGGTALATQAAINLNSANVTSTLPVANGGTGLTSMTAGFIKYNGSAVVSGQPVVASDITATEQASINAGKIRSGATSAGTAITIFVQSGTPTANATGDLWFN
jgi:hypothetical protein